MNSDTIARKWWDAPILQALAAISQEMKYMAEVLDAAKTVNAQIETLGHDVVAMSAAVDNTIDWINRLQDGTAVPQDRRWEILKEELRTGFTYVMRSYAALAQSSEELLQAVEPSS